MAPTRTIQLLAAVAIGLGILVASAVPAPAAVHTYDVDVDDLVIDFYEIFDTTPSPWFDYDWSGMHPCTEDNTVSFDDVALDATWDLELAGVANIWYLGWVKITLRMTTSGAYSGAGDPYALTAAGDVTLEFEEVSGATDCSPDSSVFCTIGSVDLELSGILDDDGHGVSGLTPSDTAILVGGNSDISTVVTGVTCGALTAVDAGRVVLELDASGFS